MGRSGGPGDHLVTDPATGTDAGPESVARRFVEAWNRADTDALAEAFTQDADFVNVVGFRWHGRRQIRHNHAIGFRDMFGDSTMALERVRTRPLGEDHAVIQARWTMQGQRSPDGIVDPGPRRGVFTFVCARQPDGTWLGVTGHNTDIVPGAQTHVAGPEGVRPARY